MKADDLISIVKNRHLDVRVRLNALQDLRDIPAPGALKQLLSDDRVLVSLTLDLHEHGESSRYFELIRKAFDL